jgi:hypothetical protein
MADQERLEEIRARHQGVWTDDGPVCDGCQDLYEEPSAWPCDTVLWIAEADRLAERVQELERLFDAAQELAHAAVNAPWSSRQCDQALDCYMLAAEAAAQPVANPLPAHQEEGG